jgi:hypothetical protein
MKAYDYSYFKLTYASKESSGEVKLVHTGRALDRMGEEWVRKAQERLETEDKKASGKLLNSLGYKASVKNNTIYLELTGLPYGDFVQFGVQGAGPYTPPKNPTGKSMRPYMNRAPNSPFRFGSGQSGGSISKAIRKWIGIKRFQWRDELGRFLSYDAMTFPITRSVWRYGIAPTDFIVINMKPVMKAHGELVKLAIVKDMANYMNKDMKSTEFTFELVI